MLSWFQLFRARVPAVPPVLFVLPVLPVPLFTVVSAAHVGCKTGLVHIGYSVPIIEYRKSHAVHLFFSLCIT